MAIFQRSRSRASGADDATASESPQSGPRTPVDQREHTGEVLTRTPDQDLLDEPTEPLEPLEPHERTPRRRIADAAPVTLFLAAHPKQAVVTAAVMAGAAAASGRAAREVAVVGATVLVGQTILGWHNDLTDRARDAAHASPGKPLAQDRVDPGTVWFALVVAVLLVVPLSLSTGVTAGAYYLVSLVVGLLAAVTLRQGRLSWVPWAASFALYPFYLSYGGWGGDARDAAPQTAMVVLAALLGVGVHFLRALWGLVADDADGWTYYPLRVGRRLGSQRLLMVTVLWCTLVTAGLVAVGVTVGLRA